MKLDGRQVRLIGIGASVAANCQPCLQGHVADALGFGISADEIAEAIEAGRKVRQGATAKMDAFAASLRDDSPSTGRGCAGEGCSCDS